MTEKQLPINHGKSYTKIEVDQIIEMLLTHSIRGIAKKLGRTPESIESKLENMGFGIKGAIGLLSGNQLANMLGVTSNVVSRWVNDKGLPATRKYITNESQRKPQKYAKNIPYLIDINVFWAWGEKNKGVLNLKNIDPLEYMPDWARDLRRRQIEESPKRERLPWTTGEISRLKKAIDEGEVNIIEFAEHSERSVGAVENMKVKLQERRKSAECLIREKCNIKDVKRLLKKMYQAENKTLGEIAEALEMPQATIYSLFKRYGIEMNSAKKKMAKKPTGFVKIGKDRLLVTGQKTSKGYKYLRIKDHPNASKEGLIAAHRVVMEQELGRYLYSWEKIKRKNDNKMDNRPENLYIYEVKSKKQEDKKQRIAN